jgi:hypothetical protein
VTNFTSAHETPFEKHRLSFPDRHIEVNPFLVWMLGPLGVSADLAGDLFVHLQRRKSEVVDSWVRRGRDLGPARWLLLSRQVVAQALSDAQWRDACELCYDSIWHQIETFRIGQRVNYMHIWLHELSDQWPVFWKAIGATGDYRAALKELEVKHNASRT